MPEPKPAQKQSSRNTPPPPPSSGPSPIEPVFQEHAPHQPERRGDNILGFFKNLLPKSMDTGDLIIVLLLLLMANDCEDHKNNALLTLALYFFL